MLHLPCLQSDAWSFVEPHGTAVCERLGGAVRHHSVSVRSSHPWPEVLNVITGSAWCLLSPCQPMPFQQLYQEWIAAGNTGIHSRARAGAFVDNALQLASQQRDFQIEEQMETKDLLLRYTVSFILISMCCSLTFNFDWMMRFCDHMWPLIHRERLQEEYIRQIKALFKTPSSNHSTFCLKQWYIIVYSCSLYLKLIYHWL